MEIPDAIVHLAVSDWFPISQGLVQFDHGAGLEELIAAWRGQPREIRVIR